MRCVCACDILHSDESKQRAFIRKSWAKARFPNQIGRLSHRHARAIPPKTLTEQFRIHFRRSNSIELLLCIRSKWNSEKRKINCGHRLIYIYLASCKALICELPYFFFRLNLSQTHVERNKYDHFTLITRKKKVLLSNHRLEREYPMPRRV